MDLNFCANWRGDGSPEQNKHCRRCPNRAGPCQTLWAAARALAAPTLALPGPSPLHLHRLTPAASENRDILYLQVNARWNLPIEDFLHYVKTGYAGPGVAGVYDDRTASPSRTSQGQFIARFLPLLPPAAVAAVKALPRR